MLSCNNIQSGIQVPAPGKCVFNIFVISNGFRGFQFPSIGLHAVGKEEMKFCSVEVIVF